MRETRAGEVDVVDVEADAGIDAPQRVGLADAADEGGKRRRLVAALIDRQVRHLGLELGDVGRSGLFEPVAGDSGHRDRHLLEVLFALAGGDDDLLADLLHALFLCRFRLCRRGRLVRRGGRGAALLRAGRLRG